MARIAVLPGLQATSYQRSVLHADERVWLEKNCYIDIWIELLHALKLEPLAMLGFTVALDFEGDQWTFFKPSHAELGELYGIDVQELNVWRPLLEHAVEHLGAGKLISTEADAYWLPDTVGTDYRRQHVKTTIVLASLDAGAGLLGYFHNAGYYELQGEDFAALFRVGLAADPTYLPLFAELLRLDRLRARAPAELAELALQLLRRHLQRRPATNPIRRFRERFELELPVLQARGLPYYHSWAFSTIRQLGAAAELTALFLRWLAPYQAADTTRAATGFEQIATLSKSLILKAARAVNSRRASEFAPLFDSMQSALEQGVEQLSYC